MFSTAMLVLFSSSVFLLSFADSKNVPKNVHSKLGKRYTEISDSLCDKLSELVLQMRDIARDRLYVHLRKQEERFGNSFIDYDAKFQTLTGVSPTDDNGLREFVCKLAGAETISDITGLINLPTYVSPGVFAGQYKDFVNSTLQVVEDLGFETLRKVLDFKEYIETFARQSNFTMSLFSRAEPNEWLQSVRLHFTTAEVEILISNMVERFGNDFPKLISIIDGCVPPYCTPSDYIVHENRIGCIADAFMLSKNVNEFATRLSIPERYAYYSVDSIKRLFIVAPDGAIDVYRVLADIIELTLEELPGLYNLTDDIPVEYYNYQNYGPGEPEPEEYA